MLCRNNPTNPNKPKALFVANDLPKSDAVSREPGDEVAKSYMVVYQPTRGWSTKMVRRH
jgi:hypothetical protein